MGEGRTTRCLLAAWLALSTAGAAAADVKGIAPRLFAVSSIDGPEEWRGEPLPQALRGLAGATADTRQAARWRYALGRIADGRPAEAHGALQVMLQDESDLAMAETFQLALGRVLVELGRGQEAVEALSRPGLAGNAEACAWRLRALGLAGAHEVAVAQLRCARPALRRRPVAERAPFLLAAIESALQLGRADIALDWLRFVPGGLSEARLLKARALLEAGRAGEAQVIFRGLKHDRASVAAAAELGLVRARVAARNIEPARAIARLEALRLRWRGDWVERDAASLSFDLARRTGDRRAALAAGASLYRYHALGPRLRPLLERSHALLNAMVVPGSKVPLDRAAGLFWDYRDLAPGGAEGERLATLLADRLQEQGLHARAAELLAHQLGNRKGDVAQGPLSVRVARLHILAGEPQRALDALRLSEQPLYPAAMVSERQRVAAVALHLLGRGREALAALQGVPASGALQAELLWQQRSWAPLADLVGRNLPTAAGPFGDVQQAVVLRHAITLAMLGREEQLGALRQSYAGAFAGKPSARAFQLLTQPGGALSADDFSVAMAGMPAASPAGELADLIDAAPPISRRS